MYSLVTLDLEHFNVQVCRPACETTVFKILSNEVVCQTWKRFENFGKEACTLEPRGDECLVGESDKFHQGFLRNDLR